jgi:transposase
VDVSSETLEARIGRDGETARFDRTVEGIAALAGFCKARGVELVAMEATGGYEKLVYALLWQEEGIEAAIVNARSVRHFAKGMGVLEKTDRIDAGVIAWFAEVKRIVAKPPASAIQEHLAALVTRLRQLTELRSAQSNQRRLVTDPTVLELTKDLLAVVAGQIRCLESEIAELIAADPLWKVLDQAFRSIKGVADRTVARLMAELPEIGTISNKAIAKLVGYAPLADDSGKHKGKRRIWGGRCSVRAILFVVAEVVRRHNPEFAAFHQRLSQAGKAKKVVRVALARKLLVQLNAKARDARASFAIAA